MGTVPARERLEEQRVVCPHCGGRFHRWGHARSFDVDSMKTLLSRQFTVREIKEKVFVTWSTLNWKGRVAAGVTLLLSKLGIHGSRENIWFVALKEE